MPPYQYYLYVGCLTALSEHGEPQVLMANSEIQRPANAYSERLMARELLLADGHDGGVSGGCKPTKLSFVPNVTMPEGKNKVLLRVSCYVDGNPMFGGDFEDYTDISAIRNNIGVENTAESIAEELFLYSGVDLMRQYRMRDHFTYSPQGNWNDPLEAGSEIEIVGRSITDPIPEFFDAVKNRIVLTLKIIDDLPDDAVDFVKEQWGHDVSVSSCLSAFNTQK